MLSLNTKIYNFIASSLFFRLVLIFSSLSAAWIALTGRYPMAFDEDFHLGLIRLYASHGLPFWSGQPAGADMFGAVARDPSYLYHFLMSFPYHFISFFTASETTQILMLRAINIGLFVVGLILFRRLLLKAGASAAIANSCLALFVLIPINSQLAAQINYDNALLPLTALLLIKTLEVGSAAAKQKPVLLLQIAVLGMLGSLIKFAFLPIVLGVIIWLVWTLRSDWPARAAYLAGLRTYSRTLKGGVLALAFVLLAVLGFERYGINIVLYQDPVPRCDSVISANQCLAYGPFERDYYLVKNNTNPNTSPLDLIIPWFHGMWLRTFFAVDGPSTEFQTRGPLYFPAVSAIILMLIGAAAFLVNGRTVYRRYPAATTLFGVVSLVYITAVFVQQYQLFANTGVPVALNGRYLLPVILLLMFLAVLATNHLLRNLPGLKIALVSLALLSALWGGGALTYILRSNDAWYWDSAVVRSLNSSVQSVLGPVTPGYDNPDFYLRY